jgi:hypothetical protein
MQEFTPEQRKGLGDLRAQMFLSTRYNHLLRRKSINGSGGAWTTNTKVARFMESPFGNLKPFAMNGTGSDGQGVPH